MLRVLRSSQPPHTQLAAVTAPRPDAHRCDNDPWVLCNLTQPSPVRDYLRYYFNATSQYLLRGGCDYSVAAVYIWGLNSWDVQVRVLRWGPPASTHAARYACAGPVRAHALAAELVSLLHTMHPSIPLLRLLCCRRPSTRSPPPQRAPTETLWWQSSSESTTCWRRRPMQRGRERGGGASCRWRPCW